MNHVFTNSYYTYRHPKKGTWRIRIERDYREPGIKFHTELPEEYAFMIPIVTKVNELMVRHYKLQDYIMNLSCLCFWIPWHLSHSSLEEKYHQVDVILKQENEKLEKRRWTLLTQTMGLFLEFEYLE
eukprot:NODE_922_length_3046_cov_1.304377.p4 type:complete len:127 gc:universal NODE_922_length_3046_cov_1.304377:2174-1794(-)